MFTDVLKFPYGLLAPISIMGLIVSALYWRKFLLIYLFLSSYIGSLVLFFVCARFRQPLIPFLILFGVYGVHRFLVYAKERKWIIIGLFLFCFCLLAVESNRDALDLEPSHVKAEDHLLIGNAYMEQGALSQAETEFRKAIAADSSYI
jgi:hypothetical protein